MSKKNQLMFIMPVMKGGGAEKVAALLLNEFNKNGYECELVLSNSGRDEFIDRGLDSAVKVTFLCENFGSKSVFAKIFLTVFRAFASFICKIPEALGIRVPASFAYLSFKAQYFDELKALRNLIRKNPDASIISFLQPSIPLVLLAARGLPNKVTVSERADPYRLLKKRYGYNFIKKYYQRADAVVFQTNDALNAYPDNISAKGTVIFNPINDKLPEAYHGEREKYITTFCRISYEKNLILLADAFADFYKENKEYRLKIIGGISNDYDAKTLRQLEDHLSELSISEITDILPFSSQVHSLVIRDAMYVNSSDHEGMSNAMLEAMAIGMPVICTDCPIGGANIKVSQMLEHFREGVSDITDEGQIADFIRKIIRKEAGDGSGLIYGMGHAVYTLSDPRAKILRAKAEEFAMNSKFEDEFILLSLIEKLTPEIFAETKGVSKAMCANVDLYSGLVYKMLDIPADLFTPIFTAARVAGWSAHRIEELLTGGKIIRPAYKNTNIIHNYTPIDKR